VIPKAVVERARVKEVILRAMAKRITWWQAAEINDGRRKLQALPSLLQWRTI